MVFVHLYEWSRRYLGQERDLVVISNCDAVELFVNGVSLGVQRPRIRPILPVRGWLHRADRREPHRIAV
jgi:hypothetical protein